MAAHNNDFPNWRLSVVDSQMVILKRLSSRSPKAGMLRFGNQLRKFENGYSVLFTQFYALYQGWNPTISFHI